MRKTVMPRYVSNSQLVISCHISSWSSLGLLSLALSTTVTQPATATNTPRPSLFRNGSCSIRGATRQLDISATTPRGDTIDAGAKP